MEEELKNMKQVSSMEAWGGNGKIKFKIFVDIDREFNENDKNNFRDVAQLLFEKLDEENILSKDKETGASIKEREEILNLFDNHNIFVDSIPNEYCNRYCCKHLNWFVVTTKLGRIKIGWRKRVINIDWSDSLIKIKSNVLFENEDVTKSDYAIHAWGLEKAQEYINRLLSIKIK